MLPLETGPPPFWMTVTAAASLVFGILLQLIQLIRNMDAHPIVIIALILGTLCVGAAGTFGLYWIVSSSTN